MGPKEVDIAGNNTPNLRLSFGLTFYPDNAEDLNGLSKRADKVMYKAKYSRKNRVRVIVGRDWVPEGR